MKQKGAFGSEHVMNEMDYDHSPKDINRQGKNFFNEEDNLKSEK